MVSVFAVRLPTSSYTHALGRGESATACGRTLSEDAIREAEQLEAQFARARPISMLCNECLRVLAIRMADLGEESHHREAV